MLLLVVPVPLSMRQRGRMSSVWLWTAVVDTLCLHAEVLLWALVRVCRVCDMCLQWSA